MSDDDNIFLATGDPVADVARWLAETLQMTPVEEEPDNRLIRLRGPARSADGSVVLTVRPNGYVNADPDEEAQAIDRYPIDIDVWYAEQTDEELQTMEARLVFDELVETRPDTPILLSHNLSTLTAAHLPGKGTHYFDPAPSLDEPDLEKWQPWVIS
ncbi:hypothetical protein [Kribbella monticola]|uniref:hypothetical protein n=1 Tax=Kribbella monticola TaxID=2185285 RepID=UPI000DD3CD61|nr:hypothetical protein [Kribbella monticola]